MQESPEEGSADGDDLSDSSQTSSDFDPNYTQRVLYQNQMEDPDIANEFDRDLYGKEQFTV